MKAHLRDNFGPGCSRIDAPRTKEVDRDEVDQRWRAVAMYLAELRARGRHAVKIVDADCDTGALLVRAVLHARELGFTAIEGRGIGDSPSRVARARERAAHVNNPAIGLAFELDDIVRALQDEEAFPADVVLWHGDRGQGPQRRAAVARAGNLVIADDAVDRRHPAE